jgi:hypothetical protein
MSLTVVRVPGVSGAMTQTAEIQHPSSCHCQRRCGPAAGQEVAAARQMAAAAGQEAAAVRQEAAAARQEAAAAGQVVTAEGVT